MFCQLTHSWIDKLFQYHGSRQPSTLHVLGSRYFTVLHSCSAECAVLTEETCGQAEDGLIYLVTLLLADVCGLKVCEHPSWCDDFTGAWAAKTRFSQLLSFHGIKVTSVCYMGSANIRYGSVCCPVLLLPLGGQSTSVCPPSLQHFHSNSTESNKKSHSGLIWHVKQNTILYG